MFKTCKYCGKVHDIDFICPQKPKIKRFKNLNNAQGEIRRSKRYAAARENVLLRDHYLCRVCFFKHGKLESERLQVHHVTPIAEDETRAFDEENMITVCRSCHELLEAEVISREEQYRLIRRRFEEWERQPRL